MLVYREHAVTDPLTQIVILAIEIVLLGYFAGVNAIYVWTALTALFKLPASVRREQATMTQTLTSREALGVSVVVPAYNESEHVIATVRSLLAMTYPLFEIIVVNDGSSDDTLELLQSAFSLETTEASNAVPAFPTAAIRAVYRSASHPTLSVIDKVNGGKADALNAGTNHAQFPLLFFVDGDSFYVPQTLDHLALPFLRDDTTVICGAGIGVANDCTLRDGVLTDVRLPRSTVAAFQVLEYLRAFFEARFSWASVNALGTVSGACGMYRKDIVFEAGGFRTDTIWEDMEMTIRVHHLLRAAQRPYRVAFTPFIVCWTMVPATVESLWKQRVGWHRHLSESMSLHRRLCFAPGAGAIGWAGLPYLFFYEWLAPVAVPIGLTFAGIMFFLGYLALWAQVVLLILVFALALPVSALSVLIEQRCFGLYRSGDVVRLLMLSVLEHVGYRQLMTLANFAGIWMWLFRRTVQRRQVIGPLVRRYDPKVSADWRRERPGA
jgi:cellulose synthase/poly-beta-1,6-N-acetylglucosamine synthase-like glycosyltransferase